MNTPGEEEAASGEAAAAPRVVLFDFDGVLIRGDSFAAFVRSRYRRAPWRLLLALPIVLLTAPLAIVPRGRWWIVGLLVRVALLGVSERRYAALAEAFVREHANTPRIFSREAIAVLRGHVAAGDRVLVVTGCESRVVNGLFETIGLSGFEVVASRLRQGWLGMRTQVHCFGARKPRELAVLGLTAWDVAYTDSAADAPMLRGAREAVLVNGDPRTCKALERALGRSLVRVDWR